MERPIASILLFGRGEALARADRAYRRLDLRLVPPPALADRAWSLPDAERVVGAAREAGADAIHPIAIAPRSRAELAMHAREAGLVFVGPNVEALACLADKLVLRDRAAAAGFSTLEGSGPLTDVASARRAAEAIGYPVVLKPIAGAFGVGVVRARDEDELSSAFDVSRERASSTLGDSQLYVERALERPRKIEIAVIADAQGVAVALPEYESSVERRGGPLVLEAPSPHVTAQPDNEAMRELLGHRAMTFARELSLVGAITIELLVDGDGRIYFLEANADMHGGALLYELLTGIDAIELALGLASGAPAAVAPTLLPQGHAFEARLAAEDPEDGFRRSTEPLAELSFPPAPQSRVRIEPALEIGEAVSMQGEPLIARIATSAALRHDALLALDRALAETRVVGPATNSELLRELLNDESLRAGQYDCAFIEIAKSRRSTRELQSQADP